MTTRRKVLITGASRGIGKAIRESLGEVPGHEILAPSRREMDLMDMRSVERYARAQPDVEILVNNAGINLLRTLETIDDQSFAAMIAVNLQGPLTLIRELVPHMKRRGFGRIVNISSIWGLRSKESRTLYSSTKFALNGATRALARELGGHGILVNAVCPGYVNTELTQTNVTPAEQEALKQVIPLGRFAEPEEVARLVRWLVSEENTYVTGQELIIDGGFLA